MSGYGTIGKLRILLSPREKYLLIGIVLLMAFGAVMELVGLGLLMPLVALFTKPELLEQNRYLHLVSSWPCFADRKLFLVTICVTAVAVYALKTLLTFFTIRVQSRFIALKQKELCGRLFRVMMGSPLGFHLRHGSGEGTAMMSRAVDMGTELLFPVMLILTDLTAVGFVGIALLALMPGITLSCAALLALLGLMLHFPLKKANSRLGRELADAEMESRKRMLEGLSGVKTIKAMGREGYFSGVCERALGRWLPLRAKSVELGQLPRLGLEFFAILSALAVFAVMALCGMAPGTLLLSFSLLIAALSRMLPAFSRIHYNLGRVIRNRYSFDSVFEWLNLPQETLDGGGKPLVLRDKIELRGIGFAYPEREQPVFRDFSLTIPARSSVALTGVTGGGKSTLADILLGMLEPQTGQVLVDGRDIRENLASWRAQAGFVPQHIFLLDDTIRANVAFGAAEKADAEQVTAALRLAQLEDFVATLPNGMDTVIGEDGVRLSGGQRQRLGIARALYSRPELLILDEATSALDGDTEQALVEALEALRGKLTIVTIAHRLGTVEKCDIKVCVGTPADRR